MAGTLLHVALAKFALGRADIPEQSRRELTGRLEDFRFGAVLPDLPYHDRICRSGFRMLMNLDFEYNEWGTLLHLRSPVGLALALLDRASDWAGKALALGFLTHFGVDVVFHTEIAARVSAEADGSRGLDAEHRRIEEQIDLNAHLGLLGHPGMGTPYARRTLRFRPDSFWTDIFFSAVSEIHGNAPDKTILARWKDELAFYGFLCSFRKAPWVKTIPDDNPALLKKSLDLAEESIGLAAKHLELGLKYLDGNIGREDFLSAVPERSMLDGCPASS